MLSCPIPFMYEFPAFWKRLITLISKMIKFVCQCSSAFYGVAMKIGENSLIIQITSQNFWSCTLIWNYLKFSKFTCVSKFFWIKVYLQLNKSWEIQTGVYYNWLLFYAKTTIIPFFLFSLQSVHKHGTSGLLRRLWTK